MGLVCASGCYICRVPRESCNHWRINERTEHLRHSDQKCRFVGVMARVIYGLLAACATTFQVEWKAKLEKDGLDVRISDTLSKMAFGNSKVLGFFPRNRTCDSELRAIS
jgi:hypothetical protein